MGATLSEVFGRVFGAASGMGGGGMTPHQQAVGELSGSDKESDVMFGQLLSGLFG